MMHADLPTRRFTRALALIASVVALSLACDGRDRDPVAAGGEPAADPDVAAAEETPAAEGGAAPVGGLPIPPARFPRGLALAAEGVSPGYVLFNPLLSGTAYLIDNDGRVVHAWESQYAGGGAAKRRPRRHLEARHHARAGPPGARRLLIPMPHTAKP